MKQKHSIDIIFAVALFTLFTLLSILLIIIGSDAYKKITQKQDINNQMRTSLSYVSTKLKSCDSNTKVFIENKENTKVLVIENEISDGIYVENLIYFYNGVLYECMVSKGDEYDLSYGFEITKARDFQFDIDEVSGTVNYVLTDTDDNKHEQKIYFRSQKNN